MIIIAHRAGRLPEKAFLEDGSDDSWNTIRSNNKRTAIGKNVSGHNKQICFFNSSELGSFNKLRWRKKMGKKQNQTGCFESIPPSLCMDDKNPYNAFDKMVLFKEEL